MPLYIRSLSNDILLKLLTVFEMFKYLTHRQLVVYSKKIIIKNTRYFDNR